MERSRASDTKLSLPELVEDYTDDIRDILISLIDNSFATKGITCGEIYVVGSACFGIPGGNDTDIVCSVPYNEITAGRPTQKYPKNHNWVIARDIRNPILRKFDSKIDLVGGNYVEQDRRCCDLGFQVPYYDLRKGELHNKSPRAILPFHFTWDDREGIFETYMRDKSTLARSLLF